MKGLYFKSPFEFKLDVLGESWTAGETLSGTLTVVNRGSIPAALPRSQKEAGVYLAHALLKKVREKSKSGDPGDNPFQILNHQPWTGPDQLAAGQEAVLSWKFKTDVNSPISDTTSSLFLLYGTGANSGESGHLQVQLTPAPLIAEFLKLVQVRFRFVLKSLKAGKQTVEAKLAPPTSKGFALLETLSLSFSFTDTTLGVHYRFTAKKIEAAPASLKAKKQDSHVDQELTTAHTFLPSGRINDDYLESQIQAALETVENKIVF